MKKRDDYKPKIRIEGFKDAWELRKVGDFLSLSKDLGHTGIEAKKLTVKLWGKGIVEKSDSVGGSENTQYYIRRAGQFMYGKLDFLHAAFGIVPEELDGYESTLDSPAFDMNEIDGDFLLNRVIQEDFYLKNGMIANGSRKAKRIHEDTFLDMPIIVPSIEEQQSIGKLFTQLDTIITLHQQEYERLICVKKAMLDKMFPQNGADVPSVRFSEFSEPWILRPFSEIFTERRIIDTISKEYPQLSFTIEEGVIRPEDRKTNKRDFLILDRENKKYLQTEYDDIIYNPANVIYGAIHRNALGKGCVSPIYKIFYTDQNSAFMECIVRHPCFINEISKSMEGTVKKLKTLKPKAFLNMSAYIAPTLEEQKKIGEYFQQLNRLIEIEKLEMEKIKNIKSACLDRMYV